MPFGAKQGLEHQHPNSPSFLLNKPWQEPGGGKLLLTHTRSLVLAPKSQGIGSYCLQLKKIIKDMPYIVSDHRSIEVTCYEHWPRAAHHQDFPTPQKGCQRLNLGPSACQACALAEQHPSLPIWYDYLHASYKAFIAINGCLQVQMASLCQIIDNCPCFVGQVSLQR